MSARPAATLGEVEILRCAQDDKPPHFPGVILSAAKDLDAAVSLTSVGGPSPLDFADVQTRGEAMIDRHGFLGVPRETFGRGARQHYERLLAQGLRPQHRLLDIGCGCLRVGSALVRYLDADRYCGIEPSRERVAFGREYLFDEATWESRRPRIDHNAVFDTGVFGERFDVFFACSIWTHASKSQIETMLDGFLRDTVPSAKFLVSYLPAATVEDDYQGSTWVGTSHESTTPGVIRHRLDWIRAECALRGLAFTELPGLDVDDQLWLSIRRAEERA